MILAWLSSFNAPLVLVYIALVVLAYHGCVKYTNALVIFLFELAPIYPQAGIHTFVTTADQVICAWF